MRREGWEDKDQDGMRREGGRYDGESLERRVARMRQGEKDVPLFCNVELDEPPHALLPFWNGVKLIAVQPPHVPNFCDSNIQNPRIQDPGSRI